MGRCRGARCNDYNNDGDGCNLVDNCIFIKIDEDNTACVNINDSSKLDECEKILTQSKSKCNFHLGLVNKKVCKWEEDSCVSYEPKCSDGYAISCIELNEVVDGGCYLIKWDICTNIPEKCEDYENYFNCKDRSSTSGVCFEVDNKCITLFSHGSCNQIKVSKLCDF
jgi:hypothetical protein